MYDFGKINLDSTALASDRAVDLAAVQKWANSSEQPDINEFLAFGGEDKSYGTCRFGEVANYSGKIAIVNRAGWWLVKGFGPSGTPDFVRNHGGITSELIPNDSYWYGTNSFGSGIFIGANKAMTRDQIRCCSEAEEIQLIAGKLF